VHPVLFGKAAGEKRRDHEEIDHIGKRLPKRKQEAYKGRAWRGRGDVSR
jgi:hypothetical protein